MHASSYVFLCNMFGLVMVWRRSVLVLFRYNDSQVRAELLVIRSSAFLAVQWCNTSTAVSLAQRLSLELAFFPRLYTVAIFAR